MSVRGPKFDQLYPGSEMAIIAYLTTMVQNQDETKPCRLTADSTVALCAANESFLGVVRSISPEGGACGVQEAGFVQVAYTGSAPDPTKVEQCFVGDGAGAVKLATNIDALVAVTVATSQTVGSSAADPTLVGGTVKGFVPTAIDQVVKDIVINSDGSVTATLNAGATGTNTLTVTVERAAQFKPRRCSVVSVDTTNLLVTLKLI